MQQSTSFDICILGSANSDLFLRVSDFPKEGETINALGSFVKNGGKGANQAVSSALLGTKSVFSGQMGKDSMADLLIKEMKTSGLDLSGLIQIDGVQTGQALIMLNQKGDNIIVIIGGANMHYNDPNIPSQYLSILENSQFLQIQMEIPQDINIQAAKYVKYQIIFCLKMQSQGRYVMLDCGGRNDSFKEELLQNLTFISPNETELERIIGVAVNEKTENQDNLITLVREKLISKHNNLHVLLKLGSNGSLMVTQDLYVRVFTSPYYNEEVLKDYKIIDTVGAGDCFTSAFCSRFYELSKQQGKSSPKEFFQLGRQDQTKVFEQSMMFASSAAFLCITKQGAMPSMPTRQDVDQFINKYIPKTL